MVLLLLLSLSPLGPVLQTVTPPPLESPRDPQPITAGLAAASTRWRDRRLAVAELRRRGVERGALRRRNTTDTHSKLKPLLYVLLTLSYKLALIATTSALCTLHKPRLSLHTSHRQRRPAERKFGTASIEVATWPAATGLHAQRRPTMSP